MSDVRGEQSSDNSALAAERAEQATLLYKRGQLAEAEVVYAAALDADPRCFDALHRLGVLNLQQRRLEQALGLITRAISVDERSAAAQSNLGSVLLEMGRFEEALTQYEAALRLEPGDSDYRYNRANVLVQLKRFADALPSLEALHQARPDDVEVCNTRAAALVGLKRVREALPLVDAILAKDPANFEALATRGNILFGLSRLDEALASFERAIAVKGSSSAALLNRAIVLQSLSRYEEALGVCDRILAAAPDDAQALKRRGILYCSLKRYDDAIATLAPYIAAHPEELDALRHCSFAAQCACDWDLLGRMTEKVEKAGRQDLKEPPGFLLALIDEPAIHHRVARAFVANSVLPDHEPVVPRISRNRQPLRLGYLSADYGEHPVSFLTAEIFELHDRSRFEVYGLFARPRHRSAIGERVARAFDVVCELHKTSDEQLCDAVRKAGIDILIDLGGHTDNGRALALAGRPAPIQVSYLGYPGTLGADFIDYALVDRFVVPEDEARHYTEKLAYLPDCFQPNDRARAVSPRTPSRAECSLPEDAFVFCCFNNSYKLSRAVFEIWMRLLKAVPGSVLWLAANNEWFRTNLTRDAVRCDVDPARLIFAPRMPSMADHLARYRRADLFLDTWPYGAHTTASDALWAGLPVLTYAGRSYAARVGGSVLNTVGLPELVTCSVAEYEARALELAGNPDMLAALRRRLEENRATTPLFDTPRLVRNLEAAYRQMWDRHLRGEAPASFAISS